MIRLICLLVLLLSVSFSTITQDVVITPENANEVVQFDEIQLGIVLKFVWSPDGDKLAVSTSGGVYMYAVPISETDVIPLSNLSASSLRFSPDGSQIAYGQSVLDANNMRTWYVMLHSLETNEFKIQQTHSTPINRILFSPDGKYIVSGGKDTITIWDVEANIEVTTFHPEIPVLSLEFNHDGTILYSGNDFGQIHVWDMQSGEQLYTFHEHDFGVWSLDLHPTKPILVSSSLDAIYLWDLEKRERIPIVMAHEGSVRNVAFNHDGSMLVSGGFDGVVHVWDATTGDIIHTIREGEGEYFTFFQPYTSIITYNNNKDTLLRFYDLDQNIELSQILLPAITANALAITNDDNTIISANNNSWVQYWNIAARRYTARYFSNPFGVQDVITNNDNTLVASGGWDKVNVWSLETEEIIFDQQVLEGNVTSVAFHPNNHWLGFATREQPTVQLWDIETKQRLHFWDSYITPVMNVEFSPSGEFLASIEGNGDVIIWEVDSGEQYSMFATAERGLDIAFHPDGAFLATASSEGTIRFWDVDSSTQFGLLDGHDGPVESITFNSNGALLASAGHDGTVKIWDVANLTILTTLVGHDGIINDVIFSSDDTFLVSAGEDSTIRLWGVP